MVVLLGDRGHARGGQQDVAVAQIAQEGAVFGAAHVEEGGGVCAQGGSSVSLSSAAGSESAGRLVTPARRPALKSHSSEPMQHLGKHGIPETWCHLGAEDAAAQAHATVRPRVRNLLTLVRSWLRSLALWGFWLQDRLVMTLKSKVFQHSGISRADERRRV